MQSLLYHSLLHWFYDNCRTCILILGQISVFYYLCKLCTVRLYCIYDRFVFIMIYIFSGIKVFESWILNVLKTYKRCLDIFSQHRDRASSSWKTRACLSWYSVPGILMTKEHNKYIGVVEETYVYSSNHVHNLRLFMLCYDYMLVLFKCFRFTSPILAEVPVMQHRDYWKIRSLITLLP